MKKPLLDITPINACYLAGFFDGEGCVGIYERSVANSGQGAVNPYCSLTVCISNTNHEVLAHIQKTCGGIITNGSQDWYPPLKGGGLRKTLWRWSAQSREGAHLLKAMLPYLIVKREQALVALEYYAISSTRNSKPHPGRSGQPPLTEEELKERRRLIHKIRDLKRH